MSQLIPNGRKPVLLGDLLPNVMFRSCLLCSVGWIGMGTGRLYRVPEGCANRPMSREEVEHSDSGLAFKRVEPIL